MAILLACAGCLATDQPLIIAHRGSPCSIPEETIEGFEAAALAGADYLEMDVVMSKDGMLICRHDITLDDSTDVLAHGEFAAYTRTEAMPGGHNITGIFAADLTSAEIRRLKAQQVMPFRDHSRDQETQVSPLRDVLRFAKPLVESGAVLGVYIETKQPSWHKDIGLPLEQPLLDVLDAEGWFKLPQGAIVLQSFEPQCSPSGSCMI
ncbi:hypothetical protein WJX84_001387 [Apatococcus fuscideae]|uniref:glycerophosphodiester phosphodiesterase n=1 Tax=Apatococcus fuscideae TaxID=2026836 RepID=A0AAW1TH69_9CHLO